jgi:crotonobetaine/carnitine-CoA ligase
VLDRDLVLPHLIAKHAKDTPDRMFIQQVDGPQMTYAQFHEANLTWANAFTRLGINPGQNVATLVPGRIEAYPLWLGLAWIRAIEVPLNTMYRGPMLRYIIDNCDAETMVVGVDFLDRVQEIAGELPKLKTVVVPDADDAGTDLPFRVIGKTEFFSGATPVELAKEDGGPEYTDVACIIYTSGTTGPSKGVLVPWPELYWFDVGVADLLDDPSGSAYYSFLPPYHVSGKLNLYLPAKPGGRLVIRDGFSLQEYWNDVRRYDCNLLGLVGPIARLLLLNPEQADDADNPAIIASCGPLFPEIEVFKKRFGVEMVTGYGMTEIGCVTITDGPNIEDWQSCGKARTGRPGYELRVVDPNDEDVGVGNVGELVVRCDEPWCMNLGYYGMPEKTAESWRNGWFHTGDGFKYDSNGNFFFVDRMKDAIRRRGENISSFEVEGYVNGHPDVVESAAVGVPSELSEDEVMIFVVRKPDSDLTEAALIEHLIPVMPRFMIPRYIEFIPEFPKTEATARTKKVDLRARGVTDQTWDREKAGIAVPK